MSGWNDPRFIITMLLIALFGYAYIQDPADEAMKGALIGAFSAAYGFWIGSKQNDKATENTGKAFEAITAAASGPHLPTGPTDVHVTNTERDPVPTTDERPSQPAPDARSEPFRTSPAPDSQIAGSGADGAPSGPSDDLPGDPTWR